MAKEISLRLDIQDISQAIAKTFKQEHSKLMTQAIMEVLSDSESDLESVFKASLGIVPHVHYFVGQKVILEMNGVSEWRFDKERMREEGLLADNNTATVLIKEVRPFSKTRTYSVQYAYIDKDSGEKVINTSDTYNSYIKGLAEEVFPGDDL